MVHVMSQRSRFHAHRCRLVHGVNQLALLRRN
jgi:hypothetical protein